MDIDGHNLLISSKKESVNNLYTEIGAVRLYQFNENTNEWDLSRLWYDYNLPAARGFGEGLAIDGDNVVIGCPQACYGSNNGFCYILDISTPSGDINPNLNNPDPTYYPELFGNSIALQDDVMIIGCKGDAGTAYKEGAFYYYRYESGNWIQKQKVKLSDPESNDFFAISIDLDEDYILACRYKRKLVRNDKLKSFFGTAYLYKINGDNIELIEEFLPKLVRSYLNSAQYCKINANKLIFGGYKYKEGNTYYGVVNIIENFKPIDEVWVNSAYCETCANDGHSWGIDAFATISNGLNALTDGGTLNISAGTFSENVAINSEINVVPGANVRVNTLELNESCVFIGGNFETSILTCSDIRLELNNCFFRTGDVTFSSSSEIETKNNALFSIQIPSFATVEIPLISNEKYCPVNLTNHGANAYFDFSLTNDNTSLTNTAWSINNRGNEYSIDLEYAAPSLIAPSECIAAFNDAADYYEQTTVDNGVNYSTSVNHIDFQSNKIIILHGYEIDILAHTGGNADPSGSKIAEHNSDLTINITSGPDYENDYIIDNGTTITDPDVTYSLANITDSHDIDIYFASSNHEFIYVGGSGGDDGNSGEDPSSSGNDGPKETIESALRTATFGDQIEINPGSGPYEGTSLPETTPSGININGNGETLQSSSPCIIQNSDEAVVLENFVFNAFSPNVFAEFNAGGNVVCRNCTFMLDGTVITDCLLITSLISGSGGGVMILDNENCLPVPDFNFWLDPLDISAAIGDRIVAWNSKSGSIMATAPDYLKTPTISGSVSGVPLVNYEKKTGNTEYGQSDIFSLPYSDGITTAETNKWDPDNSPKTLFLAFYPDKLNASTYYSDEREVLFEAGGPESGYNIYIENTCLCFGMWNRFQNSYCILTNLSVYQESDNPLIAIINYNGKTYTAGFYTCNFPLIEFSSPLSFAGFSIDNSTGDADLSAIGGACRTAFHDYNTGESYSACFSGKMADILIYNRDLNNSEMMQICNFISAKYGCSPEGSGKIATNPEWFYIENQSEINFDYSVYPNPAYSYIKIKTVRDIDEIYISDIRGRTIDALKYKVSDFDYKLEFGDLSSGIYFIVIDGIRKFSFRVVK